jgi:hypothetical protein
MGHDLPDLPAVLDDELTEASADALPAAVSERAARLEPAAVSSALRLAHARALSPFALPVMDGVPAQPVSDGTEAETEEVGS